MTYLPCPQSGLISEATSLLEQAEAGAKKQLKSAKNLKQTGRFPAATEWEVIYSDCVILLGLNYALRYALSVVSLALHHSKWTPAVKPYAFFAYSVLTNLDDSESYYGYLQCL